MKSAVAIAAFLLVLCALLAGTWPGLARADIPAGSDQVSFAPPRNMSNAPGAHPAVVIGLPDGRVSAPFVSVDNTTLSDAANDAFGTDFNTQWLDSSTNLVGSQHLIRDSRGGLHLVWYHNLTDGSGDAIIYYAHKDAAPGSGWQIAPIPGSRTGVDAGGPYKVVGLTRDARDRIYVLWGRNSVGARYAWTDDGATWSAPETLPGPFASTAGDFTLAASRDGVLCAAWFDRESGDIHVQMKPPGGSWQDPVDISHRPVKGQDYSPRLVPDPMGGIRLVWTGFVDGSNTNTDGFYRAWTPTGGWGGIVQLYSTPGKGNTGGLQLAVDPAGVNHIVWDDDTGRPQTKVAVYYIRGTPGAFTAPQAVFPQFGDVATTRYPTVDVGPGPNGATVVHISANSDVQAPGTGAYDNYYTWTDAGTAPPPPTPCSAGAFSDVPAGSAFYPWVADLVGRGAVSGYGDCTFRPNNNITRGQIAKVVVLAGGLALTNPASATFTDVPPGSAFYPFVETAYSGGLISGYGCGGPAEPCDPQSGPYFRPNADITRGQIAKMVVLARHWPLLNPSTASFADVPPGTPFYSYIETASSYRVVSGYGCGGPGEPCDPQQHPYFRPTGSATRGQAAKIVDVAVNLSRPAP